MPLIIRHNNPILVVASSVGLEDPDVVPIAVTTDRTYWLSDGDYKEFAIDIPEAIKTNRGDTVRAVLSIYKISPFKKRENIWCRALYRIKIANRA